MPDRLLQTNPAVSAFLREFRPCGFQNLIAIGAQGDIDGKTYHIDAFSNPFPDIEDWAQTQNLDNHRGVYFGVNPLRAPRAKAKAQDLLAVEFAHVDIDPREGEPWADERVRLLGEVVSGLLGWACPPTHVLDSGNGVGVFWRLSQRLELGAAGEARTAAMDRAKRVNRKLAVLFGGDNCHNLDRVMRLPGTLNYPSESKLKRGYPAAPGLSRVLGGVGGAGYSLEALEAALEGVSAGHAKDSWGGRGSVSETGDMAPLSAEEVVEVTERWERLKALDPDLANVDRGLKRGEDHTSSGMLWTVAGRLKKLGFSEAEFYWLITARYGFPCGDWMADRQLWRAWHRQDLEVGRPSVVQIFTRIEEGVSAAMAPPLPERAPPAALDLASTATAAAFRAADEAFQATPTVEMMRDMLRALDAADREAGFEPIDIDRVLKKAAKLASVRLSLVRAFYEGLRPKAPKAQKMPGRATPPLPPGTDALSVLFAKYDPPPDRRVFVWDLMKHGVLSCKTLAPADGPGDDSLLAVLPLVSNVQSLLEYGCGSLYPPLAFNEFTLRVETVAGQVVDDCFLNRLRSEVTRDCDVGFKKDDVIDMTRLQAGRFAYNPAVDYFQGLTWDGVERVKDWVIRLLGAEDTPYHRAVGGYMLCGIVQRALRPGSKFDHVPVLEGPEGRRKSTAVQMLMPREDWFLSLALKNDLDATALEMQGALVNELGDLAGMRGTNRENLKQWLSKGKDRFRAPYDRVPKDWPRQGIFIGTTNEDRYLGGVTGNRRFLPLSCGDILIPQLIEEREQLWAETVHMMRDAPSAWHLFPDIEHLSRDAQLERRQQDPWEDEVAAFLAGVVEGKVHTSEIYTHLGLEMKDQESATARRVANCMRLMHGWEGPKSVRKGLVARKGYQRKGMFADDPKVSPRGPT